MTIIHISLDIETWGKKPGCDIRSIGATLFWPNINRVGLPDDDNCYGEKWMTFYIATDNSLLPQGKPWYIGKDKITPKPSRKYPLRRDPETVQWWNDQGEEARAAFNHPVDLKEALQRFNDWYKSVTVKVQPDEVRLWTKGPHFDIAILQAAYDATGLTPPWHYRSPRDMRTIMDAVGMTRADECNYGVAHNARDDAIAQAMTICEAQRRINDGRKALELLRKVKEATVPTTNVLDRDAGYKYRILLMKSATHEEIKQLFGEF